jgi:hypothetical protein
VESTLLLSSILVCLLGLMLGSEFAAPGSYFYNLLGSLTVAVISISLVYYFTVVWTEVVAFWKRRKAH